MRPWAQLIRLLHLFRKEEGVPKSCCPALCIIIMQEQDWLFFNGASWVNRRKTAVFVRTFWTSKLGHSLLNQSFKKVKGSWNWNWKEGKPIAWRSWNYSISSCNTRCLCLPWKLAQLSGGGENVDCQIHAKQKAWDKTMLTVRQKQ